MNAADDVQRGESKHEALSSSAGPLKVTLVVATYERGSGLQLLLDDLEKQTLGRDAFEVVIVDDGSKKPAAAALADRTTPLALRLIRQDNAGAAAARHRGITEARADIVVITDDDMRLPPHFLEAHLRAHESGASVVFGHIRPSTSKEELALHEHFHAWMLERQVDQYRKGARARGWELCTGNVSFRRADYFAVGGFDPELQRSEDRDLGIRLERQGGRLAFSEEAYSVHESDHTSLEGWLKRVRLYGIYDSRIGARYPDIPQADPWAFFFMVNPLTRPFLALTTVAPEVIGARLARGAIAVSYALDRRGLGLVALRGMTFAYGVEYFRGMRENAGSLAASARSLASYLRRRSRAKASTT